MNEKEAIGLLTLKVGALESVIHVLLHLLDREGILSVKDFANTLRGFENLRPEHKIELEKIAEVLSKAPPLSLVQNSDNSERS